MTITIHQPDMLPWLGFFNKLNNADIWVILDHTHNNPRDASFWGRRVKMLINGEPKWISLPLMKPETPGVIGLPIKEIKYNITDLKPYKDSLQTIEQSYKKARFFSEIFPIVEKFFNSSEVSMPDRNLEFIFEIMHLLEIETEVVYSSNLMCEKKSTDLLIEIVKKLSGNRYLCGGGAVGYQEDSAFSKNGIELVYNNFTHPIYKQLENPNFHPGLSIVDALMNLGIEKVRTLIKN